MIEVVKRQNCNRDLRSERDIRIFSSKFSFDIHNNERYRSVSNCWIAKYTNGISFLFVLITEDCNGINFVGQDFKETTRLSIISDKYIDERYVQHYHYLLFSIPFWIKDIFGNKNIIEIFV